MDAFRIGRPKYGLIEHKIKYIIGSCQKRHLADTLGKPWIFDIYKN